MLEKFLVAYKNLEQALREDNVSVLEYENCLNEENKEKLKVCRIIRNYAAHNDKKFIACTKEQIKFLEDLYFDYIRDKDIVENYYTKLPLTENKLQSIAQVIQKKRYARIDIGIVDAEIFVQHYGKRKITKCLELPVVDVNERMKDLQKGVYAVTKKNKIVGIVEKR